MTSAPAPATAPELATLLHLMSPPGRWVEPSAALPRARLGAREPELLLHALRRTRVIAATRLAAAASQTGLEVVRPVRGVLRGGLRDRLRRMAGSGYVAYPASDAGGRLLDRVLEQAGATLDTPLTVGADGAVRARVHRAGVPGLLRIGVVGTAADPGRSTRGLELLAALSCPRIPRVLADGTCEPVGWVVEQVLPGARPTGVTGALADQVATFVASLPRATEPPTERDGVAALAAIGAGHVAAALDRAAGMVASSAPSTAARLRHGDLWAGNLLVVDGTLTGVVDWDAWDPSGLPAVDLLHLVATEQRIRTRASLGEVWLRRPWDEPEFVAAVRRHWPEWGGDARARYAVGLAWWIDQLAADVRRNPSLGEDARWVERNLANVAAAI